MEGWKFQPREELELDCFVDADYAGSYQHEDDQDPMSVILRTGFGITLGTYPVTWV